MNDREIRAGKQRFFLGKDNILRVTIVGEIDKKTALEMGKAFQRFQRGEEGPMDIFVDNSRSGKPLTNARTEIRRMVENDSVGKIAVFGANPVAKVISNFVIGMCGKKDMRIFDTREEAFRWLRGEDDEE